MASESAAAPVALAMRPGPVWLATLSRLVPRRRATTPATAGLTEFPLLTIVLSPHRQKKGVDLQRNRNARLAQSVQVSTGAPVAWILLSGGIRASGHGIRQDHVGIRGSQPRA